MSIPHPAFGEGQAVTWTRTKGVLTSNVPHIVTLRTTEFDVGNSGDGAGEFALNILTALFPPSEENGICCKEGVTSPIALRYYQSFKYEFLADAAKNRGRIYWTRIAKWLKETLPME